MIWEIIIFSIESRRKAEGQIVELRKSEEKTLSKVWFLFPKIS